MLIRFFLHLRAAGLTPGLNEFLLLLAALKAGLAQGSVEQFHALARAALIKDETQFDRYDRAFGAFFDGLEALAPDLAAGIPADWLRAEAERLLSEDEKARIEALGGWQALMDTLAQRLKEQQGRHHGGAKWIGTAGTSPFGHAGYHPEGVRIGGSARQRRAVKVWEQRSFQNLDDSVTLGTRNVALALRKLRRFAREGAAEELDLDGTVRDTARNAGLLGLRFRPERHNAVKLLLLLDVGGSMDEHVRACEALFSAARAEFKYLEHWYFHNCLYERVWRDNARRFSDSTPTFDLLHKYPADWRLVFVGDASMSPHELLNPGGSVEHWNEEPGATWLGRALAVWSRAVWLNPVPEAHWDFTPSIGIVRELIGDRMFPLTLDGIGRAIERLKR